MQAEELDSIESMLWVMFSFSISAWCCTATVKAHTLLHVSACFSFLKAFCVMDQYNAYRFGEDNQRIPHCIRMSQTECDLTAGLTDLKSKYEADVVSEPLRDMSSDLIEFPRTASEQFCPYQDSRFLLNLCFIPYCLLWERISHCKILICDLILFSHHRQSSVYDWCKQGQTENNHHHRRYPDSSP